MAARDNDATPFKILLWHFLIIHLTRFHHLQAHERRNAHHVPPCCDQRPAPTPLHNDNDGDWRGDTGERLMRHDAGNCGVVGAGCEHAWW
jgi:hypothetical protein